MFAHQSRSRSGTRSSSNSSGSGSNNSRRLWHCVIHNIGSLHGIFNDTFKLKIYGDWANHYLQKANFSRLITDLQLDISDGVGLADVIAAVTNKAVDNINRTPTDTYQMIGNIATSLRFLSSLGIDVDGLDATDICDGNVKSILQLFFNLSRYKQQQKLVDRRHRGRQSQTSSSGRPSTPSSDREQSAATAAASLAQLGGLQQCQPRSAPLERRALQRVLASAESYACVGALDLSNGNNIDMLSRLPQRRSAGASRLPTGAAVAKTTGHGHVTSANNNVSNNNNNHSDVTAASANDQSSNPRQNGRPRDVTAVESRGQRSAGDVDVAATPTSGGRVSAEQTRATKHQTAGGATSGGKRTRGGSGNKAHAGSGSGSISSSSGGRGKSDAVGHNGNVDVSADSSGSNSGLQRPSATGRLAASATGLIGMISVPGTTSSNNSNHNNNSLPSSSSSSSSSSSNRRLPQPSTSSSSLTDVTSGSTASKTEASSPQKAPTSKLMAPRAVRPLRTGRPASDGGGSPAVSSSMSASGSQRGGGIGGSRLPTGSVGTISFSGNGGAAEVESSSRSKNAFGGGAKFGVGPPRGLPAPLVHSPTGNAPLSTFASAAAAKRPQTTLHSPNSSESNVSSTAAARLSELRLQFSVRQDVARQIPVDVPSPTSDCPSPHQATVSVEDVASADRAEYVSGPTAVSACSDADNGNVVNGTDVDDKPGEATVSCGIVVEPLLKICEEGDPSVGSFVPRRRQRLQQRLVSADTPDLLAAVPAQKPKPPVRKQSLQESSTPVHDVGCHSSPPHVADDAAARRPAGGTISTERNDVSVTSERHSEQQQLDDGKLSEDCDVIDAGNQSESQTQQKNAVKSSHDETLSAADPADVALEDDTLQLSAVPPPMSTCFPSAAFRLNSAASRRPSTGDVSRPSATADCVSPSAAEAVSGRQTEAVTTATAVRHEQSAVERSAVNCIGLHGSSRSNDASSSSNNNNSCSGSGSGYLSDGELTAARRRQETVAANNFTSPSVSSAAVASASAATSTASGIASPHWMLSNAAGATGPSTGSGGGVGGGSRRSGQRRHPPRDPGADVTGEPGSVGGGGGGGHALIQPRRVMHAIHESPENTAAVTGSSLNGSFYDNVSDDGESASMSGRPQSPPGRNMFANRSHHASQNHVTSPSPPRTLALNGDQSSSTPLGVHRSRLTRSSSDRTHRSANDSPSTPTSTVDSDESGGGSQHRPPLQSSWSWWDGSAADRSTLPRTGKDAERVAMRNNQIAVSPATTATTTGVPAVVWYPMNDLNSDAQSTTSDSSQSKSTQPKSTSSDLPCHSHLGTCGVCASARKVSPRDVNRSEDDPDESGLLPVAHRHSVRSRSVSARTGGNAAATSGNGNGVAGSGRQGAMMCVSPTFGCSSSGERLSNYNMTDFSMLKSTPIVPHRSMRVPHQQQQQPSTFSFNSLVPPPPLPVELTAGVFGESSWYPPNSSTSRSPSVGHVERRGRSSSASRAPDLRRRNNNVADDDRGSRGASGGSDGRVGRPSNLHVDGGIGKPSKSSQDDRSPRPGGSGPDVRGCSDDDRPSRRVLATSISCGGGGNNSVAGGLLTRGGMELTTCYESGTGGSLPRVQRIASTPPLMTSDFPPHQLHHHHHQQQHSSSMPRRLSESIGHGSGTSTSGMPLTSSSETAVDGFGSSAGTGNRMMACPSPKRLQSAARDDEWHGSMLSLISNTSSVYSTAEEKQAQEVRKLRRELEMAQEKINTLTTQLCTNVHVVTAFEKSLSNMTQRLQKLTSASEQKDAELCQLRMTLMSIQQQAKHQFSNVEHTSVRRTASLSGSTGGQGQGSGHDTTVAGPVDSLMTSHSEASFYTNSLTSLSGSFISTASHQHQEQQQQQQQQQRHQQSLTLTQQLSADNKKQSKINWLKSSLSKAFSRGRRRSKKSKSSRSASGAWSDTESEVVSSGLARHDLGGPGALSMPNSPTLAVRGGTGAAAGLMLGSVPGTPATGRSSRVLRSPLPLPEIRHSCGNDDSSGGSGPMVSVGLSRAVSAELVVVRLQQQLREKELKLTDIQLEALTSAHQLESLRDAMNRMKSEIASLKSDNERMQRMIKEKGTKLNSSSSSNNNNNNNGSSCSSPGLQSSPVISNKSKSASTRRISLGDPTRFDVLAIESLNKVGHKISVFVRTSLPADEPHSFHRHCSEFNGSEILIGTVSLDSSTNWETMDSTIRRVFKKYVRRLDAGRGLGLGGSSFLSYKVGEIVRSKGSKQPELLPCGYLVGENNSIFITLKGARQQCVDELSFSTLIPKPIVDRYASLLVEHHRIILCGPTGTGKTYLARRLAEHLVVISGRSLADPSTISTFNVDQKSGRELRQYLASIAERCCSHLARDTSGANQPAVGNDVAASSDGNLCDTKRECEDSSGDYSMPVVLILDDLQHVGPPANLVDAFSTLLGIPQQSCPFIIGTMTSNASSSLLQVHHNFRWILYSNHSEPVSGFLGRYLQRRLVSEETATYGNCNGADSAGDGFGGDAAGSDISGSLPGRGTRSRLSEGRRSTGDQLMHRVVEWLPRAWQHINRFLESHGSGTDVTIGPRLFLSCPMEGPAAQLWFTDLWNYSIIPYIIEALRDITTNSSGQASVSGQGAAAATRQQAATRPPWQDPTDWVIANYPWQSIDCGSVMESGSVGIPAVPSLLRLRPDDVGYGSPRPAPRGLVGYVEASDGRCVGECGTGAGNGNMPIIDPLTTMLLRLQEATTGSSSPVPSNDDYGSDTSTGSGTSAATCRMNANRNTAGEQ